MLSDPKQSTSTRPYLIPAHKAPIVDLHEKQPLGDSSDLECCFISVPNNYLLDKPLRLSVNSKSSSSLLTRLDNQVLKAGRLFA